MAHSALSNTGFKICSSASCSPFLGFTAVILWQILYEPGDPTPSVHFKITLLSKRRKGGSRAGASPRQGWALLGWIFCSFLSLLLLALVIFLHKFPKSDKGNLLCAHKALGISWRHIIPAIILLTWGAVVLVKLAHFLPCKEKKACWGFFINHFYTESCSSRLHSDHFWSLPPFFMVALMRIVLCCWFEVR